MTKKNSSKGYGPDNPVGGTPNGGTSIQGSKDPTGWAGGRFTRAERNQAAFLGAIAGDCPCDQCDLHRSISQAVANPGTQF